MLAPADTVVITLADEMPKITNGDLLPSKLADALCVRVASASVDGLRG